MTTEQQLNAMTMEQLAETYSRLTGTAVKRFRDRPTGVKRCLAALAANTAANARSHTCSDVAPRTPESTGKKSGRPPKVIPIKLRTSGRSTVRESSLRGKVMQYLRASGGVSTTEELEQKFGKLVRGALNKLFAAGWIERQG